MKLDAVLVATTLLLVPGVSRAEVPSAVQTPPLASGRSLSTPSQITTGDVLARALLLRENVDLIRRHMGRPKPNKPLIHGEGASMAEVYFNALSVRVRVSALSFELLRTPQLKRPPIPKADVTPADVLRQLDRALAQILSAKSKLGIAVEPARAPQSDDVAPTVLFNVLLALAGEINNLLETGANSRDAYTITTKLIHDTMSIHLSQTRRPMPNEPAWIPNQTPQDVFEEMMACFDLLTELLRAHSLSVVKLKGGTEADRLATVNDLIDVGIMMVAELDRLLRVLDLPRKQVQRLAPGRKYPSDVLPRTKLLRAILEDVLAKHREAP